MSIGHWLITAELWVLSKLGAWCSARMIKQVQALGYRVPDRYLDAE